MWQVKRLSELSATELLAIMRLRVDTFVVEQHRQYHEVDDNDAIAYHVFARADTNAPIQAYARVFKVAGADHVTFGRVATATAIRGRGMGAQLLDQILRCCAEHWPGERIVIEAQQQVTGFYARVGFRAISAPFIFNQTPHVRMALTPSTATASA